MGFHRSNGSLETWAGIGRILTARRAGYKIWSRLFGLDSFRQTAPQPGATGWRINVALLSVRDMMECEASSAPAAMRFRIAALSGGVAAAMISAMNLVIAGFLEKQSRRRR